MAAQNPAKRKVITSFVMLAITAGVLSLILLSPLLFRQLGGTDWNTLSQIGQTYGAASAIVSALALGGVAVSLFLQAGQARAHQIQMVREYQLELVRMVLEDPNLYIPCWRPIEVPGLNPDGKRQHLFITLRMNYALMGYEIGVISERGLRGDTLAGMFKGSAGREYWEESRQFWFLRASRNRQTRAFLRIVDEEYEKAVAAGPPIQGRTIEALPQMAPRNNVRVAQSASAAALLGMGAGVLIGVVLHRQQH
jgi:uncharacterized protein DUF6082